MRERIRILLKTNRKNVLVGILILSIVLVWFFFLRTDSTNIKLLEKEIAENKEINQYITEVSFNRRDSEKVDIVGFALFYPYYLHGTFNERFNELPDDEKFIIFNKVVKIIETKNDGTLVNCGFRKYCDVENIIVFTPFEERGSNSYDYDLFEAEFSNPVITHVYRDDKGKAHVETISKE